MNEHLANIVTTTQESSEKINRKAFKDMTFQEKLIDTSHTDFKDMGPFQKLGVLFLFPLWKYNHDIAHYYCDKGFMGKDWKDRDSSEKALIIVCSVPYILITIPISAVIFAFCIPLSILLYALDVMALLYDRVRDVCLSKQTLQVDRLNDVDGNLQDIESKPITSAHEEKQQCVVV